MTRLQIILSGLAAVLVLATGVMFAFGLRLAPLELRSFDRSAAIAAADGYDAEITRDSFGVARVIGETDADAAFAFAFAHAEDDFPTIQDSLRVSLGPDMLAGSESQARMAYLVQALGVLRTVDAQYQAQLSDETRAFLEGYAAGLNYYAALNPGEAEPDLFPVTGEDVAALSAFFSPLFYGMSRTLSDIVNPDGDRDVSRGQELQVFYDQAAEVELGSNAFAIAPSRSSDGATRLVVNSHQPVEGPLAWYETHLISREGLDFAGGAFPGGPIVHLGANQSLAHAATVNSPDLIDVYELELTEDGERYMLDGEEREFERFEARILVKLFGPFAWSVTREVEQSEHGPVLRTGRGAFAVRYATMGELQFVEQAYLMMRARTLDEFDQIMRTGSLGATNRLVADTSGGIARYYNARMPVRIDDPSIDWEATLPGNRSDLIWTEFEPFDRLPHMVRPAAGYVLDSNHSPFQVTLTDEDPDPASFPDRFGIETQMTNRGLRATQLFAEDTDGLTSREELLAVKYDDAYHPDSLAMQLRDDLLDMDFSGDDRLMEAQDIVRAWNGQADEANMQAAMSLMTFQPIGVALFLGEQPPTLEQSFRDAVDYLMTYHGALEIAWVEVNRLKRGDQSVGLGGGPDTLRAVNSTPDGDGTLRMVSGDGFTLVWEAMPDGEVSVSAVHQFGSTSRPDSPHYTDQMALFADESFRILPMGEAAVRGVAERIYRPGTEG
jgi:penicillin amidase/acyl-homoserine-lactone acylase